MNSARTLTLLTFAMVAAQTLAPAAPAQTAPALEVPGAEPPVLHIVYLAREGDAAYQPVVAADGVMRPALPAPLPGADLALRDTQATARAAGVAFALDGHTIPEGDTLDASLRDLAGSEAVAVIADLPAEDFVALARRAPASLAIFNIRHRDDALRRDFCGGHVFHVVPATSMLTDALVQFIVGKAWRRVLVLHGPLDADRQLAATFGASARKFGARVIDTRQFAYGNDPRKRDQIDIGLLSGGSDYDIVFLADTAGDYGRSVPYDLAKPRPVMGTEGLQASAWEAIADRFGAPQVNHRFARLAHRDMGEGDWAAWVAVRAVVEAAVRAKARTAAALETALAHDDLPLDVGKGIQSSFRAWDHQLRQAIMLHTSDAVIAYAPIEGFLHRRTPLDTLGADEGESGCR